MLKAPGLVVVGGGTGFIGKHVVNLLTQKGYTVNVVSRMPGPGRISWNSLNATGLPEGTTAVINLAGQNVMDITQRWSSGFKQNVFNSRVLTTQWLREAIAKAAQKPKAFVAISGVGGYKPHSTIEYKETSDLEVFDFFSKLCREWENAAQLPDPKECRQVIVRSGVVLGRDGGMIKQLYLPFFCGLGGPVGNGSQYMPWIHVQDLARLLIHAIENDKMKGVYNGVAPEPATNKEFSNAFAKALNRPAVFPLPHFVLNTLLSEERANMITKGQKVLPTRYQECGFTYEYPNIVAACSSFAQKNVI